jgi:hypothetical protein
MVTFATRLIVISPMRDNCTLQVAQQPGIDIDICAMILCR